MKRKFIVFPAGLSLLSVQGREKTGLVYRQKNTSMIHDARPGVAGGPYTKCSHPEYIGILTIFMSIALVNESLFDAILVCVLFPCPCGVSDCQNVTRTPNMKRPDVVHDGSSVSV